MGDPLKRVLVVDDDEGILDSFEVLIGDRCDLIKAESGYKALRILENDLPRLIFLDIRMPGIDGIEILKRIRKEKRAVEVVIITASNQETVEDEARSLGVSGYLKKPLDIVEIDRVTARALA
jgi:CheY-like chemotaxis protein